MYGRLGNDEMLSSMDGFRVRAWQDGERVALVVCVGMTSVHGGLGGSDETLSSINDSPCARAQQDGDGTMLFVMCVRVASVYGRLDESNETLSSTDDGLNVHAWRVVVCVDNDVARTKRACRCACGGAMVRTCGRARGGAVTRLRLLMVVGKSVVE